MIAPDESIRAVSAPARFEIRPVAAAVLPPVPAAGRHWVGKAVVIYFAVFPLLWVTGLALPIALILMPAAAVVSLRTPGAFRYAWSWYAVGFAQLLSVLINWVLVEGSASTLVKHVFSSYISGWFLLGAAISTGASGLVPLAAATTALSRIACYWAVLAVPATAAALLSSLPSLTFVTPIGRLLPGSLPSKSFSFSVFVFAWDELFGLELPRIVLLFPWANILGVAGIAVTLAGLAERGPRRWRLPAIGIAMISASLGRLPILALAVVLVLRAWLGLPTISARVLSVTIPLWSATAVALAIGLPSDLIKKTNEAIAEGRPGSSQVRAEVYEGSWRGFYDAPFIGHGWPGEAVIDAEEGAFGGVGGGAVVGSHSTISGLLYKGGLLSFIPLVFAFLLTSLAIAPRVLTSTHAKSALCFVVALALTCGAESLESFAMPLLSAFIWLGAVLRVSEPGRETFA